jgi:hypothetical protein
MLIIYHPLALRLGICCMWTSFSTLCLHQRVVGRPLPYFFLRTFASLNESGFKFCLNPRVLISFYYEIATLFRKPGSKLYKNSSQYLLPFSVTSFHFPIHCLFSFPSSYTWQYFLANQQFQKPPTHNVSFVTVAHLPATLFRKHISLKLQYLYMNIINCGATAELAKNP